MVKKLKVGPTAPQDSDAVLIFVKRPHSLVWTLVPKIDHSQKKDLRTLEKATTPIMKPIHQSRLRHAWKSAFITRPSTTTTTSSRSVHNWRVSDRTSHSPSSSTEASVDPAAASPRRWEASASVIPGLPHPALSSRHQRGNTAFSSSLLVARGEEPAISGPHTNLLLVVADALVYSLVIRSVRAQPRGRDLSSPQLSRLFRRRP